MIEIKILGGGCFKCKKLEDLTKKAINELKIEANIEKITDFEKMQEYGLLLTPGLVINDKLVSEGQIPLVDEIKILLNKFINNKSNLKEAVKNKYSDIAKNTGSCSEGCCSSGSCALPNLEEYAALLGYSVDDIKLKEASGANLGLGCGNPIAVASLNPGEIVLDLGSGAGFDCFLAAKKVGPNGKVIGIDMTPEMIEKARANAEKNGIKNVEFILSEIEKLPLQDNSIDVVISNCVVNLSPDKASVFKESLRVLKPGGRFIISDVVAIKEIPENIRADLNLYTGCMAGATPIPTLEKTMKEAGFSNIRIEPKKDSSAYISNWAPKEIKAEDYVTAATIFAYK